MLPWLELRQDVIVDFGEPWESQVLGGISLGLAGEGSLTLHPLNT